MCFNWPELHQLAGRHGDAFFLLDLPRFTANCTDFIAAFRAHYPGMALAYSYKTNYLPPLCREVQRLGGYAEVVSRLEYDLALRVGVPGDRIVFNGPLKTREDLECAFAAGSLVNLDCLQEVDLVGAIAAAMGGGRELAVGLRCNFDVGTPGRSRFGLGLERGELEEAVRRLRAQPGVRLAGLHCHFSTPTRSVDSYRRRVTRLIELSDRFFPSAPPDFLDVGGGYFGRMPAVFAGQFDCPIPSYAEYAQAIAIPVRQRFGSAGPVLFVEPGAAVVADVMDYVGRVVAVKDLGVRRVALVVGSVHNVRPTLSAKKLPVALHPAPPDQSGAALEGPVDLVGYTCMEHDCLHPDFPGRVAVGDFVTFGQVGAYTVVFKPPFIRASPPVLVHQGTMDSVRVARRGETFDDVFATCALGTETGGSGPQTLP